MPDFHSSAAGDSITREEFEKWYRPRKEPVTLRLDADVVAWFKKEGRGYQTRINTALRGVMRGEQNDSE